METMGLHATTGLTLLPTPPDKQARAAGKREALATKRTNIQAQALYDDLGYARDENYGLYALALKEADRA